MPEARNLLPNPKPANAKRWWDAGATLSFDDTGMRVEGRTNNSYANTILYLEPGEYVACATLVGVYNDNGFNYGNCMYLYLTHADGTHTSMGATYTNTGRQYTVRFIVLDTDTGSGCKQEVILRAPLLGDDTANVARWARVGVFTAADWEAMQTKGIEWFDGDAITPTTNMAG